MKRFIAKVSKSFKGGEKGFTLIELLIVIVILGVLAAAIIPNLSKFIGSGEVGAANAELASVRTAIGAYQADHDGDLPAADVATGGEVTPGLVEFYMTGLLKGTYECDETGAVTLGSDYSAKVQWDDVNLKWEKVP
jgi:type IV pilus assembly protein PilA